MKERGQFLKLIIGYKAFMGIIELILSVSFFKYLDGDMEAVFKKLALNLNLNTENHFISSAIKQAGMVHHTTYFGITCLIFIFGVFNLVEAYGLHLRLRWAEWLTVIATGLLIPYELYEVLRAFTVFKLLILVINTAIVYYLAKHRELFKRSAHGRGISKVNQ